MSDENQKLVEAVVRDVRDQQTPALGSETDAEEGSMPQIYHRLKSMGFSEDHLQAAQAALDKGADLTAHLDWLLLNVDNEQLPKQLAAGTRCREYMGFWVTGRGALSISFIGRTLFLTDIL